MADPEGDPWVRAVAERDEVIIKQRGTIREQEETIEQLGERLREYQAAHDERDEAIRGFYKKVSTKRAGKVRKSLRE